MGKLYQKLHNWVSELMEDLCSRLSPRTQRLTVFILFFSFAICSLFVFGDAIYKIGKKDGQKEIMKIEHIDSVPLIKNDTILQKISTDLWTRKTMKG